MTDPHVNDVIDGSPGGFIESVKRTLVLSLREALTDTTLSMNDTVLHVDMEYPFEQASYPSAWVQFSFSELTDSGLGHSQTMVVDDQEVEVRQWMYRGRVTITFLALSSLDRDRIADKFITVYTFATHSPRTETLGSTPDTNFLLKLNSSPYVSMTIQSGTLKPLGQNTTVGVPWDPGQLVYEDTYTFNLEGEFQQAYIPGEGYRLRRIMVTPEHSTKFVDSHHTDGGWV